MPGPRTKRKRPEIVTAPVPRRPRRDDAATGTQSDPESKTHPPPNLQNDQVPDDEDPGEASVPDNTPQRPSSAHASLDDQLKQEQAIDGLADAEEGEPKARGAPRTAAAAPATSRTTTGPVDPEALLSHRRLLLERVRQAKRAAQQRLDEIHQQEPTRREETLDQEMAQFKETSRIATSIARKQSLHADGSAAGTEKRTSVSLRRGSSVGKRMNAALSTLVGSSSASLLAVASSAMDLGDAAPEASASQSSNLPPTSVGSAAIPVGGPDPQSLPVATQSSGTTTAMEPNATSDANRGAAAAANSAAVGRPLKKDASNRAATGSAAPSSQLPRGGVPKHARPASAVGVPAGRSTGHKSGGSNSNKPGSHQLPQVPGHGRHLPPPPPPQPSVFCPETAQLRERKKALEAKLNLLLTRRQESSVVSSQSPARSQPASREAATPAARLRSSSLSGPSDHSKANSVNGARRKTQWDYVLEELRWLSTDVVEERKWKLAIAKSLALSVVGRRSDPLVSTGGIRSGSVTSISNDLHTSESRRAVRASSSEEYHERTAEDLVTSRRVAGLMASMISELATAMGSAGGLYPENPQEYVDALNRYRACRDQRDRRDEPSSQPGNVNIEGSMALSAAENGTNLDSSDDKVVATTVCHRDDEREPRISQFIDNLVANVKSRTDSRPTKRNGLSTLPFSISAAQAQVIETVEDIWQRARAGAVVGGPPSSGKTVVACALLSKHAPSGPQLVVCAPLSVIRWMHELGRFDGVRRKTKVLDAGISAPMPESGTETVYEERDVLVCDFATASTLSSEVLSGFSSVVVDTRYSSRLEGFGDAPQVESPSELVSPLWWIPIASCSRDTRVRRLLVDSGAPSKGLLRQVGLSDRQLLDLLALRLVFLTDASVFEAQGLTLAKSLLKWARQRIKRSDNKGTKLERIRSLLSVLCDYFYVEPAKDTASTVELSTSGSPWELQGCDMSNEQRVVYERFCREAQAALSTAFDPAKRKAYQKSMQSAAEFLFQLRRLCFHSDLHRLATKAHNMVKSALLGPSQPNFDATKLLLKGSGKLQRLVSFLVTDCNVKVADVESLNLLVCPDSQKVLSSGKLRKSQESAKRIVILGSLPESLLLVTCLLYSLGVDHECLLHPLKGRTRSGPVSVESQAVGWARSQLALSRINDDARTLKRTSLVVATPEAIVGAHGALGIESADVVISLDEHWSGRSQRQLDAVVSRCLHQSRRSGTECRFVKFFLVESCESAFLFRRVVESESSAVRTSKMWSVAATGAQAVDLETLSGPHDTLHRFVYPASNIHAVRNQRLASVLSLKLEAPRLFGSRQERLFLPLIQADERYAEAVEWLTQGLSTTESAETRGLHVKPSSIVDSVKSLGRLDLAVLPSRLYLTSFKSLEFQSVPTFSSDASAAPLPPSLGVAPIRVHAILESELVLDDGGLSAADSSTASALFYCGAPGSSDRDRRVNEFACTFSTVRSNHGVCLDGHLAQEALVYHPPLFPRLLECFDMAVSKSSSLVKGTKRKGSEDPSHPITKRPRLVPDTLAEDGCLSKGPRSPGELEMEIEVVGTQCDDAESTPSEVDDDFGFAAVGALPLPNDSIIAAASTSLRALAGARGDTNIEWFFERFPSDSEESQRRTLATMNAMILFVSRKRSRGLHAHPGGVMGVQRVQAGGPIWASNVHTSSQYELSDMYLDLNGARKKPKKKPHSQKDGASVASAFNRPSPSENAHQSRPVGLASTMGVPKSKDAYRSRLLISLRHSTVRGTLHVAPSFRAAMERVRLRVSSRLKYSDIASGMVQEDTSASLNHVDAMEPLSELVGRPHSWMSLAEPLPSLTSVTGEKAVVNSEVQATAFRRSLANPCRVDFGPFRCGFLSLDTGMSSVLSSRPIIGVSLPMGVKLSAPREMASTWSTIDSQYVHTAVRQFGANWGLVSRFVCGFQDVFAVSQRPQSLKSPRMCREHWTKEMKNDDAWPRPTMPVSEETTGTRVVVSAKSFPSSMFPLDPATSCFLLPGKADSETSSGVKSQHEEGTAVMEGAEAPTGSVSRRAFDHVLKAKALQHSVALSMPGVTSGSPPATVASHPSHMQAVQASAAFSWSNGRTEMWPLQLLDASDRQRTSVAATASVASAASGVSRAPSVHPPGGPRTSIRSSDSAVVAGVAPYPHPHPPALAVAPPSQRAAPVRVQQRPPSEPAAAVSSASSSSSGVPHAVPPPSSSLALNDKAPLAAATRPILAPARPPPSSSLQSFQPPPAANQTLGVVVPPLSVAPVPPPPSTAATAANDAVAGLPVQSDRPTLPLPATNRSPPSTASVSVPTSVSTAAVDGATATPAVPKPPPPAAG